MMNQQFLYLNDPLKLKFDTEITERLKDLEGRQGVILTRTYFYPTGGGQAHDTGWLGKARVLDVIKSEDGEEVIHILDRDPGEGILQAEIDHERRLRHMQHHSAQHLLSGCFQQELGLETLSSSIHGWEATTIDLPDTDLRAAELDRIESAANQMVYENRAVKSYFVPAAEIDRIPLRRPPKVSGEIRIVEIDGFDYSACGATHCPQTGMIGAIKILRTERINQKTRVHFGAGMQAMDIFRRYYQITTSLAVSFSTHPDDLVDLVGKQATHLHQAEKDLRQLRAAYSNLEAQDNLANAENLSGDRKLILKAYENRPPGEIRALADEFKNQEKVISMLATYDGKKIVLVTTCGPESGQSARELLNRQLAAINGRGGGDDQIAQGGSSATAAQFKAFFEKTRELL